MNIIELLTEKLTRWAQEAVTALPNLGIAIVIFVVFWVVSRYAARALCKGLGRVTKHDEVKNLAQSMARVALIALGGIIALRILKLDGAVTSLLAGVGVLGLALGFAFQDIAANFVSGILLAIRRPFQVGDIIKSNDFMGTVQAIDLRATQIETFEGQRVTIPNKDVFGNAIINYSVTHRRRVDLVIGVSYGDDLGLAEEVALAAVSDLDDLSEKGAELYYEGFGSSSIDFRLRLWIDPSQGSFLNVRHCAIKRIKQAFDEKDITIPFPIRTLDFGIEGGLPLGDVLSANQTALTSTATRDAQN